MKALAAFGLASIGFLITAATIHGILRLGVAPERLYAEFRSEKLEMLDADSQTYTTAAFGSSHVHDGFDPRSFDAACSGTSIGKSFNLGVDGGSQTEQRKMAQAFLKYLEQRGATSATILLELNAGVNFQGRFLIHPRTINIYDLSTVRFVTAFSGPQIDLKRRIGRSGFAIAAGALHYMSMGMLSAWIFNPDLRYDLIQDQTENGRRGFNALDATTVDPQVTKAFASRTTPAEAKKSELGNGNLELLHDLAQSTHIQNVRFVYVVMPTLGSLSSPVIYPADVEGPDGSRVPIINLGETNSGLFQPALWHDTAHVNELGAAVLSRLLGEKLRAYYGQQQER